MNHIQVCLHTVYLNNIQFNFNKMLLSYLKQSWAALRHNLIHMLWMCYFWVGLGGRYTNVLQKRGGYNGERMRGERTHHIRLKPEDQRTDDIRAPRGTQNRGTPRLTHLPTARNPVNGELWLEKRGNHNRGGVVRIQAEEQYTVHLIKWENMTELIYLSIISNPQSWKCLLPSAGQSKTIQIWIPLISFTEERESYGFGKRTEWSFFGIFSIDQSTWEGKPLFSWSASNVRIFSSLIVSVVCDHIVSRGYKTEINSPPDGWLLLCVLLGETQKKSILIRTIIITKLSIF